MNARTTTEGQRLAADAAAAADVRNWQTHPDVVALRVERIRTRVDRLMWAGIVLGLLFTMVNVQQFAAAGAAMWSLAWWSAWLLDPTVSVVLLGVLIAEREASRWQIEMGGWSRVAKWSLLSATYVMNTWQSWAAGDPAGIVLHSVPPLAVFVAAEAVTACQDKLSECVHRAHAYATERAAREANAERDRHAAEQARSAPPVAPAEPGRAPIPPPAPVPFRAVPVRSASTPANRTADRPGERPSGSARTAPPDRSGPGTRNSSVRKQTGTPRTDAQLSRAVRELAEQNGGPPSQYAVKQALGVGSGRAARLLAELDDTTPAGDPSHNGAARGEGVR